MNKGALGCLAVLAVVVVVAGGIFLWGTGVYNQLVSLDEGVKTAWSQVENAYQRRADLIPNLVRTVEGAADFERGTLTDVIEARSRATAVQVDPGDLSDPAMLERYEQAQEVLGSALSRLLVVVERYPELKANENFLELQAELAGTENRIAVERRRYNEVARSYNTRIRSFPQRVVASWSGFEPAAYFEAAEGAEEPPQVEFEFRER